MASGGGGPCVTFSGVVKVTMKLLMSKLGFTDVSLITQGSLVGEGRFRLSERHRKSHGVVKQRGRLGNPDAF